MDSRSGPGMAGAWVGRCPLVQTSHNAPDKKDVLGKLDGYVSKGKKVCKSR